jgi:T5SS/PEP-CTERM-associated repeat protein
LQRLVSLSCDTWSYMNRIYRLVLNRSTGLMQVASEITSSKTAAAPSRGTMRRPSPLNMAMMVALGLSTASLRPASAAAFDFNADETITTSARYAEGFRIGPSGTAVVGITGNTTVTSTSGWVTLGATAAGNGTLNVLGPGAILDVNGFAPLFVGYAGVGMLSLQDGGQVVGTQLVSFGHQVGGTGAAQVTGSGSQLTAEEIIVGGAGHGTLDVGGGGAIVTNRSYAPAFNYGLTIGADNTGTGTVTVSDRGSITVRDNFLLVGVRGAGTLNIGEGGAVVADRGVTLGSQGGSGNVTVESGAVLSTARLILGGESAGSGQLKVMGSGVVNTDSIWVGSRGDGLLQVTDGAVLRPATELMAERSEGWGSNDFGQAGKILVSGNGSVIESGNVVTTNHLVIDNAGAIRSATARIKDSYSPIASIATVTGPGSNWTNSGAMEVESGLDVLAGAVISSDTITVDGGLNSATLVPRYVTEQVRVSGAGSLMKAANGITIGKSWSEPFGVLVSDQGGRVDSGTGITLGSYGYFVLGGGLDEWSREQDRPLWRAAEVAGEVDGGPITMQNFAGGLVFNHTGAITLANTIASEQDGSWRGGAIIQQAGDTTLSGDLTAFGGDISVRGGRLQIDSSVYTGQGYSDTSLVPPQQIDVSGGTLVLNGSAGFNQTFSYLGNTGVVRSSNATVRNGGVLAGNATLGTTFAFNGGVLSPGNSGVGSFNIEGDLYINAAPLAMASDVVAKTFYDVDVLGDGQADFIKVSGKAYIGHGSDLGGSMGATGVRVTGLDPLASYQSGRTYTILNAAGGVNGGFDDVISNSAFITPTLLQTDNDVLLTIAVNAPVVPVDPVDPAIPVDPLAPVDPVAPVTPVDPGLPGSPGVTAPIVFGTVAVTGNHRATAAALDSLQQSGDALALYNGLLMLDEAGALGAFDELAGELHASKRALLLDDRFLREGISQRLRPDPSAKREGSAAWAAGSGTSKRSDGDGNAARTQDHRQGLIAGYDWTFGERWTVGVAGGPESLRQQIRARNAITEVDAVHGGLYAGFRGEQAWINGGASYADYEVETRRDIGAGTSWAQALDSRHDAHAVSAFAEGGWNLQFDALTLSPYLALAYTRLSSETATETGGTAALSVASSKDEVWTTTAGIRASWDISGGQQDGSRFEAGLAWQNAAGELRADSRNRFVAGSDSFTVQGLPLARNVGIAEVGVSLNTSDNSRLSMFAQGRTGDGQREVGAQLNWNVAF